MTNGFSSLAIVDEEKTEMNKTVKKALKNKWLYWEDFGLNTYEKMPVHAIKIYRFIVRLEAGCNVCAAF